MKTIFTLPFFFILLSHLPAQYPFIHANVLDRSDGLPDNITYTVEKSEDGFIWVGTTNGLCRFDGSQSKVWKNNLADPRSLPGNDVFCVLPQKNKVWVGTDNGLAALDVAVDTFIRYAIDLSKTNISRTVWGNTTVSALHFDAAGDFWVAFRFHGLFRYLPQQDSFVHYPFDWSAAKRHFKQQEVSYHVLSLGSAPGNDSTIYVGTTVGLQEIGKRSRRAQGHYFHHADPDSVGWQNAVRRLYFHDNGLLYVGSWHAWVHVFDPRNKTFLPLPMNGANVPPEFIAPVNKIIRKSEEEIWITCSAGVLLYHTGRQEVVFFKKNNPKNNQIFGAHLTDERGRIWFASDRGLMVFDPVMQQFSRQYYGDLNALDPGYTLHVRQVPGSDEVTAFPHNADGFFHFNRRTQSWRKTPVPSDLIRLKELGSLNPKSVSLDPAGNFTISTPHGLMQWSPKNDRLTRHPLDSKLEDKRIVSLAWDGKGRLWLGSNVLQRYDPQGGEAGSATGELRTWEKELNAGRADSSPKLVDRLFVDTRGNVWFTREGGFGVWAAELDSVFTFLHFEQPERTLSRSVEDFTEDRQGRVWMLSHDAGLGFAEAAHPERGIVRKIELNLEKAGNRGYEMTTDLAGNAWVWAKKSLVKIAAGDLQPEYFSFAYAPPGFDAFTLSTLADGTLALGEPNFITLVNPVALHLNDELPEPYITEFLVQQRQYPNDPAASGKGGLKLRHWENFFSFAFSAKAFTLGKQVRFRYRLVGFQDEWTEAGERRFVNYTNVPGGSYVFQLQAANNEGVWNEKMLELPVFVATAWWATWWFRLLLLVLVGAAAWSIWRYRIGQIRHREQLKTEFEKKLANVEMSALLAQMNPHFLFNSLNSIDNYILKNQSQKASEYLNNFARLMRLILQRSRSNYVSLKDELEALELYIQMEALRFKDRFSYQINVQENLDTASLDIPPMLLQPFVENAIWHGLMHLPDRRAGRVSVSVSQQNGNLCCVVEDNGIGRQRAAEIRAYRPAGNKKSVGMRITQDRLEMMNKLYDLQARVEIVDLKNEHGEAAGTRVELIIPV